MPQPTHWKDLLAVLTPNADHRERMLKEIELSKTYVDRFMHGTSGHMSYWTIASLARVLDTLQQDRDELAQTLQQIRESAPSDDMSMDPLL